MKIPKDMGSDATKVSEKTMSLEEFKAKYKDYTTMVPFALRCAMVTCSTKAQRAERSPKESGS